MATANCAVTKGDFPIEIFWLFKGRPIDSSSGVTVGDVNKRISTISIDSVSAEHAGEYTCVATNPAGIISYSANLNVNGTTCFYFIFCFAPVQPQIVPFEFGEQPINSGDMVIVNCAVTKGDLPLKISWLLNGKPVGDVMGVSVDSTRKRVSQLNIDSVSAEHAGQYSCLAKNRAGSTTFSATLNVNGTSMIL